MAFKTPDQFEGPRYEEESKYDRSAGFDVGGAGGIRFDDATGAWIMVDDVGTFDPRTGGGLSEAQHGGLDYLGHEIVETAYLQLTKDGNDNYTNATYWTDSGKTLKLREYAITYNGNDDVTQVVAKQYNGAGALLKTLTLPIGYVSDDVDNIDQVLT